MSEIISFGDVRTEAKSCDVVLINKKAAKQAQTLVPTIQSRSIEKITFTKQKTINTQGDSTFGCCMLSDGRFAFTSYYDTKIIVCNIKGLIDFEVKMPYNVYDLVYISNDNTLAVTSGASVKQCITIIDLKKKQIKKTISLDSRSYGIALKDNRLIYSGDDKGIRMMNLYNESQSDIVRIIMPSKCNIATFRDKIYHTNSETNTVKCYNLQGEIQWTFQNKSILKNPRDVDSDGNVNMAGYSSNNVLVISPDGQRQRELLTRSYGLIKPMALHYSGPIYMYSVHYNKTMETHFVTIWQ